MQHKKLELGQGLAWYGCGWNLFKQYAVAWVLLTIVFMAITFVCFLIPFIGPLAYMLLLPALAAGFYLGADNVKRGSALEVGMLFRGLTRDDLRTPLLILGAILLALMVASSIVMMLFAGPGSIGIGGFGAMEGPGGEGMPPPQAVFSPAMAGSFLVGLIIQVLISMCFFLAVPMVAFDQTAPVEAIKTSFRATASNIVPFLLFVISYIILAFIASIPFLLGFLVLFPVAFCAVYCAYQEVLK